MSIRIMAEVWASSMPPRLKLVALALADHADDDGNCWPATAKLCAKTGQSERTVLSALRELEAGHALKRQKRPNQGTLYQLDPGSFEATDQQLLPDGQANFAEPDRQLSTDGQATSAEPLTRTVKEPSKGTVSTPSAPRRNGAPHANGASKIDFDGMKFNGITDTEAVHWQSECYPAISIPDQIARAAEWLKSNPANRKSNYRRFLTNWFGRAQDKARPKP